MSQLIEGLVFFLTMAIFARVVLAWFPGASRQNPFVAMIYQVTDPILTPLRRVVPTFGSLDLTPMIAILIINSVRFFL